MAVQELLPVQQNNGVNEMKETVSPNENGLLINL